jgi:hypothetical protein
MLFRKKMKSTTKEQHPESSDILKLALSSVDQNLQEKRSVRTSAQKVREAVDAFGVDLTLVKKAI